jgi:hypothetical protein
VVVGLGLSGWWWRRRLTWLQDKLRQPARAVAAGLGFEAVNGWVTQRIRNTAMILQVTQTGQLNWNVVGVLGGLLAVLVFLAWGA